MQREIEFHGADEGHSEVRDDVIQAVPSVELQTKSRPQGARSESRLFRGHEWELRH